MKFIITTEEVIQNKYVIQTAFIAGGKDASKILEEHSNVPLRVSNFGQNINYSKLPNTLEKK